MFRDDVDDQHVNALSDDPHDHCLKMFACYTCQAQADSTHPEQFLRSSACMMNMTTRLSYQSVEDNGEMMLLIVRMVLTTVYVG